MRTSGPKGVTRHVIWSGAPKSETRVGQTVDQVKWNGDDRTFAFCPRCGRLGFKKKMVESKVDQDETTNVYLAECGNRHKYRITLVATQLDDVREVSYEVLKNDSAKRVAG